MTGKFNLANLIVRCILLSAGFTLLITGCMQNYNETDAESKTEYQKPSEQELRDILNPLQFQVTQRDATERAFDNEYWDNKKEGIYVDLVSGEALFSSTDKYDSGTGWPSFTKPISPDNVIETKDYKLIFPRIEIRSKNADSHLGHLFDDGPEPTGLRYCMNSAALRFIPLDKMKELGYGEYLNLFYS